MGPWAALGLQRDFGVQPGGQMLRFGSPLGFWSSWEILGVPGVSISSSGLITGGFGCGAESLVASKPLMVAHAAGPGVLGELGPQAACPGGSGSDPPLFLRLLGPILALCCCLGLQHPFLL